MDYYRDYLKTPIGNLVVEATENALVACHFLFEKPVENTKSNEITQEACFQLKAYFKGQFQKFDLPLRATGTAFQEKVWRELQNIPLGKTLSYGQLARQMGDPNLVRAVGSANGRNPLGIIIPCHRVIGAGGSLVGYAGGLYRKKWLLKFEGALNSGQLEIF